MDLPAFGAHLSDSICDATFYADTIDVSHRRLLAGCTSEPVLAAGARLLGLHLDLGAVAVQSG